MQKADSSANLEFNAISADADSTDSDRHGKEKNHENSKKHSKDSNHTVKSWANPELAAMLREYGENYGLEEDPYLEGLSNAIEEGKNLAVWASNDVMTLMPHPDVEMVEGPLYSAMVLIRNVLVFVPVALTWLAVGKATTAFSIYTSRSAATSVVNFLQFWQSGYGLLSKEWTLSRVAEFDFYIIASVIFLTFVTPFMNRSSIRRVARFEQDAMRERLTLVIEVESFLFDKRRVTPESMDSTLAQSFERVVEASRHLAEASKSIESGLKNLPTSQPMQVISADVLAQLAKAHNNTPMPSTNGHGPSSNLPKDDDLAKEVRHLSIAHMPDQIPISKLPLTKKERSKLSARELEILQYKATMQQREEMSNVLSLVENHSDRIESAAETLDTVTKRVDGIVQSLPRRAHARKALKQVESELHETLDQLVELQEKLGKRHKKAMRRSEIKNAKREEERRRALENTKNLSNPDITKVLA